MAYKGQYKPDNPSKYRGNVHNVIYRSLWERKFMVYCDNTESVIEWGSEEIVIPYKSPWDGRIHRYFPDFIVRLKQADNKEITVVLEVKPYKQTQKPTQKRQTKRFIQEAMTYAVNQEKWRAADLFCKEHGWQFKIITEKELGL